MEFVDSCVILKIKRIREIQSEALFAKSFTEYEVKISFHSMTFLEYRRYRQFLEFKAKVLSSNQTGSIQAHLPKFPKKKILHKSSKLAEERRIMLEKWLNAIIGYKEHFENLMSFLNIPESIIRTISSCSGCKLTSGEQAIASLLKNIHKMDKNGNKYLKDFSNRFFSHTEQNLSQGSAGILLKTLIPLCSFPTVACAAIHILYKLLTVESYRWSDYIQQALLNNIELLREMKIDLHILNSYQQQTGLQGYEIAKIVKECFDRNRMSHYFMYFLNYNEEAFQKFSFKEQGKLCRDSKVCYKATNDWAFLNTDNYPGALKVAYRKVEEHFEVKGEIIIEAPAGKISYYLKCPDKRKEWDLYMEGMKIIGKPDDQQNLIWYSLKKDKKTTVDLSLQCRITESPKHCLIVFNSISSDKIPVCSNIQRVTALQSYYEIQSLGVKVRRSSSTTDEIESEDESSESCQSHHISLENAECKTSKLFLFFKMKPEMARCFVDDLSEETSVLKESLVSLKKAVESSSINGILMNN